MVSLIFKRIFLISSLIIFNNANGNLINTPSLLNGIFYNQDHELYLTINFDKNVQYYFTVMKRMSQGETQHEVSFMEPINLDRNSTIALIGHTPPLMNYLLIYNNLPYQIINYEIYTLPSNSEIIYIVRKEYDLTNGFETQIRLDNEKYLYNRLNDEKVTALIKTNPKIGKTYNPKKLRVTWSEDMKTSFIKIYFLLDKKGIPIGSGNIHSLIFEEYPFLTERKISSHLQKFLQKNSLLPRF